MDRWDEQSRELRGDDRLSLSWEDLGEGYDGDWDPQDPDDRPLLRFTVLLEDEQLDGCSYCTQLPVSMPPAKLEQYARLILARVREERAGGGSGRRACQELSWLDGRD